MHLKDLRRALDEIEPGDSETLDSVLGAFQISQLRYQREDRQRIKAKRRAQGKVAKQSRKRNRKR